LASPLVVWEVWAVMVEVAVLFLVVWEVWNPMVVSEAAVSPPLFVLVV